MSLALSAVGYLSVIAAVSWLAHMSHIPERYIVAMAVIMLGIGVMNSLENTRQRDSRY
jgi:hypothetical protein